MNSDPQPEKYKPEPEFRPAPEYRPEPAKLPTPERPREESRPRESSWYDPERASTPSYTPLPNLGGDKPQVEPEAGKGGRRYQSVIAAAILAVVAIVGIATQMPHHSDDGTNPQQYAQQANDPKVQGQFTVSVDGEVYGRFAANQSSVILDRFVTAGDEVTVTCVSLPPGTRGLAARVGTDVRVYETGRLQPGQTQTWTIRRITRGENPGASSASDAAVNWFADQAQQGNAVAQYGMGNMYAGGINGLPVDHAKAIDWFQRAAAQNYANASARITDLQKQDQQPK